MKIASLTCTVLGLLGGVVAALTALDVIPGFLDASSGFSSIFLTTLFWVFLSGLLMLAAIAFGVVADKE